MQGPAMSTRMCQLAASTLVSIDQISRLVNRACLYPAAMQMIICQNIERLLLRRLPLGESRTISRWQKHPL